MPISLRGFLLVAALASAAAGQRGAPIKVGKDRPLVDTLHVYQPGIDILHYDLSVALPGVQDTILGRARIDVRRAAGVDTLRLDLLRLRVDTVLLNGSAVAFRRDDRTIRIPLSAAADSFSVTVVYHGVPADGLVIRRDSLGRRTVFGDNWPDRARHWIPSVDHPSDKATVTWTVWTRDTATIVANGRAVAIGPAGTRKDRPAGSYSRWRESRPIPTYLMVFAAAPLVETSLGETACGLAELGNCVPQSVFTAPELASYAPGPFAEAPEIVRFFAATVGLFPYEKLAHLQSSTRFGGMENASAIFYSDAAFRRRSLRAGLIAHETAHQWFGNSATERQWSHLWLSEGFATYFEQLWHEHRLGRDSLRAGMLRMRSRILAAREVAERPVIDTGQTDLMKLLNANSYQKGGFVLHMLRALVGDTAFFRGVRTYYTEHRHGTALTGDFQRHVERASGRQLGWFFDQWLRRPGFATVSARWVYDAEKRSVAFKAVQSGRHGFFRLTLPVEVDDGSTVRRVMLDIPAQAETRLFLPIDLPNAPIRITIDPDAEVLAAITAMGL